MRYERRREKVMILDQCPHWQECEKTNECPLVEEILDEYGDFVEYRWTFGKECESCRTFEKEFPVQIRNMTPHPINLVDKDGKELLEIPPDPEGPVRLSVEIERAGHWGIIPLTKSVFGKPTGLPEKKRNTLLVVSQMVKNAIPDRNDLCVPAEILRDEDGQILGFQSLGI